MQNSELVTSIQTHGGDIMLAMIIIYTESITCLCDIRLLV